ncbi:hypothetical protein BAL199_22029 [alpha proteobacterium BAL199]|jgi:membrane protein implicated in regulation of membrane protease activity|nr:hypothetical protein BAL199_22029 [alpha proteobacterium BAL199]
MKTRDTATLCLIVALAGMPSVASAYVGPGAGLSLAAAFWAILVAIGTIMAFTLSWPVRRLLRRRAAEKQSAAARDRNPSDTTDDMMHDRGIHNS